MRTRQSGKSKVESRKRLAPAFSMIELLIAIMILGLGLTMAATVFPVGLDMTRDTLQMQISQAATDAAMATVRVKVPALQNLTSPTGTLPQFNRILVPNVVNIELTTNGQPNTLPDTTIDTQEQEVLSRSPVSFPGWNGWGSPVPPLVPPLTQPPENFIDRCRVFTELTGWDAELSSVGFAEAFVLSSQNFPADTPGGYASMNNMSKLLSPTVPIFGYSTGLPAGSTPSTANRSDMVRVSLLDSVYPPIDLLDANGNRDPKLVDVNGNPTPQLFQELADRRYSWTVIHHRISSSPSVRDLLLSIVVTHRADPAARYARQKDRRTPLPTTPPGLLRFDLSSLDIANPTTNQDRNPAESLMLPLPDDTDTPVNGVVDTDTLFPQPWLVILNTINVPIGEVQCTKEVAKLLPTGSFFIIARTQNNLVAGTAHKVLNSRWDETIPSTPDDPSKPSATLQLARDGAGVEVNVPVWIFPPPIEDRNNPARFGARSPVVGVALRSVEAP